MSRTRQEFRSTLKACRSSMDVHRMAPQWGHPPPARRPPTGGRACGLRSSRGWRLVESKVERRPGMSVWPMPPMRCCRGVDATETVGHRWAMKLIRGSTAQASCWCSCSSSSSSSSCCCCCCCCCWWWWRWGVLLRVGVGFYQSPLGFTSSPSQRPASPTPGAGQHRGDSAAQVPRRAAHADRGPTSGAERGWPVDGVAWRGRCWEVGDER